MTTPPLLVSPNALVDQLFKFSEARHKRRHAQFVREMIVGILGSQSTVVSNIARFLDEDQGFNSTENRLCRMLSNDRFETDELRARVLEIASRQVTRDDIIAFDPGDLCKSFATKMEKLYRVHDGSKDVIANGFEDFSVEAIQWRNGTKVHIPLYQKLMSASCEDYISQNRQIIDAIRTVQEHLQDRGIWTFDRGHDRSRILEKALLPLPIRWILRSKENRSVVVADDGREHLLMDLAKSLQLTELPGRILSPHRTGYLHAAWTRIILPTDCRKRALTLLAIKDARNTNPVILLTNLPCNSEEEALEIFGYYIARWGKEEGYRFLKSFINTENIRTQNWQATQNLAFLSFLTYVFIALFHRSNPTAVEELAEQKLQHFRKIEETQFKYYRVGQLMRLLLCEQLNRFHVLPSLTEVG